MPTTYAIPNGATQFAATLYNGTSATQTITNGASTSGTTFQPDFVWNKCRSNIASNVLTDSVRGANLQLFSDSTSAEQGIAGQVTGFNSNGFTVGADANGGTNFSGRTYVGWQWKAGGTAVTNTSGSISSQVSANPTAGFSIVTYTCPSAVGSFTVGHGLGIAPSMIFVKDRSSNVAWIAYHKSVSTTTSLYLVLNSTAATASAAGIWGAALPTSTVFGQTQGVGILANSAVVAYCFSEIAGYSKFGSYTGNGAADGPFVYLGFRPRFVLFKRTDVASNWEILDGTRDPTNVVNKGLQPNLANAESSPYNVDFVSNGFKIRTVNTDINAAGTYVYAAFAENPFKYANAR